MLRNEVARYTELSGNDGLHTPIGIIGAYLDGYEKGRADAQPKLDENTLSEQQESDKLGVKTGETCTDCISRQAAIDEIARWIGYIDEDMILRIQTGLKKVQSAQSEPLTDKEQRIFLAAMSREEKVCKQVDVEYGDCREPYENSLVSICHEITRKVKDALWT